MFLGFHSQEILWTEHVGRRCRLAKAEMSRRNALVTPVMVFSRLLVKQSSVSLTL
jgi:hypothetical protein